MPAPASTAYARRGRAPWAEDARSSTSAPAPSPSTKPSRPLSKGRDAEFRLVVARRHRSHLREAGDVQRVDARLGAADHARRPRGRAATGPGRGTIALRTRMRRRSPWCARRPARRCRARRRRPGPLGMFIGISSGETRPGPFSSSTSYCASKAGDHRRCRCRRPPPPGTGRGRSRRERCPRTRRPPRPHAAATSARLLGLRSRRRARTRGSTSARVDGHPARRCAPTAARPSPR